MPEASRNPGRTWRSPENDGDGDRFFDQYRYTPHTTDLEFFRDPVIHETEVPQVTREGEAGPGSRSRGKRLSDERFRGEIGSLLAHHPDIDASGIRAEVDGGVLTLSGHVDSQEEKQMAARIARNAFGVQEILNRLEVGPQSAADRAKQDQ